MVYFFDQLSRRVIFFICAIPCFLSASLPMPSDEGLGLPIDASSGSMPSQPMPSPDLGTASMPNDLQTPMPMSLLPTPSLPIQSPTPDILTATQETSSQIAPITVTTTAPIIQKSPTSATLGSNINNVPTGMKTAR
jgi:hypothetical protein